MVGKPVGIGLFQCCSKSSKKGSNKLLFQLSVIFITFIAYASLHAARKPFPVTKSKLKGGSLSNISAEFGWAPFNSLKGDTYFAILDSCWSFSYAIGMFVSGYAAEYLCKRLFLTISLFGTAVCLILFGIAQFLNVHNIFYFATIQVINGVFQSIGWPCIIPIMSNWISKESRGKIFGLWNNHGLVGNVLGQSISAIFVSKQWGFSFIVIGVLCFVVSMIVVLFLVIHPKDIGINSETDKNYEKIDEEEKEKPISFRQALLTPGVIEYSFSLFFCKFVVYTFLFLLPFYISEVGINNFVVSSKTCGLLAALFDVGGIAGNIIAGFIEDATKSSGLICFIFQVLSAVTLYFYSKYGSCSLYHTISLLLVSGAFVSGPNSIITGSISANLGDHKSGKNSKGGSTVVAIIDGFGSLGAAIAPIIVYLISKQGWNYVMYFLMCSCAFSGLFLSRIVIKDIKSIHKRLSYKPTDE